MDVLRDRDQEAEDHHDERREQRRPRKVHQALVAIDPHFQIGVETGVIHDGIAPHEPARAGLTRELGERECRLARRCRDRDDLVVDGQPGAAAVLHEEQTISAGPKRERTRQCTPHIRG